MEDKAEKSQQKKSRIRNRDVRFCLLNSRLWAVFPKKRIGRKETINREERGNYYTNIWCYFERDLWMLFGRFEETARFAQTEKIIFETLKNIELDPVSGVYVVMVYARRRWLPICRARAVGVRCCVLRWLFCDFAARWLSWRCGSCWKLKIYFDFYWLLF